MPSNTIGVGIVYFTGIADFVRANNELIHIVEIEPQTFWYPGRTYANPFTLDSEVLDSLRALEQRKILHGVGFPVGGSIPPDVRQLPLLKQMINSLEVPWISEHLSFNRAETGGGHFNTGFLLPPLQSPSGIASAVRSIKSFQEAIKIPFSVETGVNYLKPRKGEIPDGMFVKQVVEQAGCGILLDLHNIYANEVNGRQRVEEFLSQVPLDRVEELHVAGGFEYRDYWLDAHSGKIPDAVMGLAKDLIPHLKNLKAIIYEVFPSFYSLVGDVVVKNELEKLNLLLPNPQAPRTIEEKTVNTTQGYADAISTMEWENILGALVVGHDVKGDLADELKKDPAIKLMNELIGEFRGSMLFGTLKMTSRLLIATLGTVRFQQLLTAFWGRHTPEIFAAHEAINFARFIEAEQLNVLYLNEILAFEKAAMQTMIDKRTRVVKMKYDPLLFLTSMSREEYTTNITMGQFEIEITPDKAQSLGNNFTLQAIHH